MVSVRESLAHGCASDETVALFLAGSLGPDDERAMREHIDVCSPCRGLLAEAGRESALDHTKASASPATPPAVAVGDVLGNKYRIDAVLGSGGMGTVYRGWHLGLNRVVAIKIMHAELLTDDLARRFAREARAAASLTNVHTARIIDIDRLASGLPFMVMEHLEGRDLHAELTASGPMEWERAARYALHAAEALAEAHALGIIHRDLKPHNLFLTTGDVVKVLDFGLAKTLPDSLARGDSVETKTTSLIGSPQYMAPEQIRAATAVDARTDVYGLGAALYQLLTGVPPFSAPNLYVLCSRILNEPPDPFSSFRKDVPPGLETVVLRCLAKLPAERHATMDELAADLRAAVADAIAQAAGPLSVDRDAPEPRTLVVAPRIARGTNGAPPEVIDPLRDAPPTTRAREPWDPVDIVEATAPMATNDEVRRARAALVETTAPMPRESEEIARARAALPAVSSNSAGAPRTLDGEVTKQSRGMTVPLPPAPPPAGAAPSPSASTAPLAAPAANDAPKRGVTIVVVALVIMSLLIVGMAARLLGWL